MAPSANYGSSYINLPPASNDGSSWGTVATPSPRMGYPSAPFMGHIPLPKSPAMSAGATSALQLHPWVQCSSSSPMPLNLRSICRNSRSHKVECQSLPVQVTQPNLKITDPASYPPAGKLLVHFSTCPSEVDGKRIHFGSLHILPSHPNGFVTVKDVIVTIVEYLQGSLAQQAYNNVPREFQKVSSIAFNKRTENSQPAFYEGLKLVDLLGDYVIFAGLWYRSDGLVLETAPETRRR